MFFSFSWREGIILDWRRSIRYERFHWTFVCDIISCTRFILYFLWKWKIDLNQKSDSRGGCFLCIFKNSTSKQMTFFHGDKIKFWMVHVFTGEIFWDLCKFFFSKICPTPVYIYLFSNRMNRFIHSIREAILTFRSLLFFNFQVIVIYTILPWKILSRFHDKKNQQNYVCDCNDAWSYDF